MIARKISRMPPLLTCFFKFCFWATPVCAYGLHLALLRNHFTLACSRELSVVLGIESGWFMCSCARQEPYMLHCCFCHLIEMNICMCFGLISSLQYSLICAYMYMHSHMHGHSYVHTCSPLSRKLYEFLSLPPRLPVLSCFLALSHFSWELPSLAFVIRLL